MHSSIHLYEGIPCLLAAVPTKPFFLTYVKRETDVRITNIGLVDIGFLLSGQRTRLVPSRPTDG